MHPLRASQKPKGHAEVKRAQCGNTVSTRYRLLPSIDFLPCSLGLNWDKS
jgi:hypothetical protein